LQIITCSGDNLLLDEQNNVKLGDFGIAIRKMLTSAAQGHSLFFTDPHVGGTIFWVAPEVLIDKNEFGRRSDLWYGTVFVCNQLGSSQHMNLNGLERCRFETYRISSNRRACSI
jgi:serine/threonine protein kinase